MKKTYIIPEMEIVKLNACQQLLSGSNIDMGSGDVDPDIADAPEFFGDDDNTFTFEDDSFGW